jgi:hypothetical protein
MKLRRKITHLLLLIGVVKNNNAAHDEPLSVFPEKGFIRARKARVEIAGYDLVSVLSFMELTKGLKKSKANALLIITLDWIFRGIFFRVLIE